MRKRRRRLAHQLFWNLTWRLELFTHIVPVPISIYFSAILVPMNPRQSMIAFVAGGISGVLMLVLGVLWRYVRIRRIFGRKADDLTLKKSLLHHPPLEGLVIALRWLVGVPLAHAMFIAYEGQLNLSLHSSAPFLLLIIAPVSMAAYFYITESVLRPFIAHRRLRALAVPGLFRPGYFGRLLFTVVALMLMPLTMQVYLIYQFIYGKLKITDPLLHIGIIVALFLVPTVIAAFAVARAVRAGLSDTHRVLSQLGDGRFDVSAAAQTADEFGEQAIHLNNVIHRLREMYDRIETMNQNLEATVKKRTKQLETSLEEVRTLKSQQDGDYYLTSHLLRPLSSEDCESETIQVQQLVRQKKKFRFRDQSGEIGGDLCTFHDLRLRNRDYLVFLNGDAMGKSIQGAGGAIVLGTVFKSIVARSAMIKSQGEKFPEQWLRDAFQELRTVFASFDGFMQASAVVGLMDQLTGFLYFFSADHPPLVLYREGKASFVPVDAQTMRLGVEGLGEGFHLSTFSLQPGDVILAGSDGRDDLVLSTSEDGIRQFNDDENAFLSRVEESGGDLNELLQRIQNTGEITDDLSLLRIAYRSDGAGTLSHPDLAAKLRESRTAYRQGDFGRAALLYEQLSDLEQSSTEHLFHASYCHKLDRSYTTACDYGERCRMRAPYYVRNLVNLADCHRLLGNRERCLEILEEATRLEPENPSILKLQSMLHRISSPAKI